MSPDDELPPLVFERLLPHPPARVWTALTDSALIARWLMENDFAPVLGQPFSLRAQPVPGWSGVTHCVVEELVPNERLVYRWGDGTESDSGLQTRVTWTLSAVEGGTLLRLEHSGFRAKDMGGYKGMGGGWPSVLGRVDALLAAP